MKGPGAPQINYFLSLYILFYSDDEMVRTMSREEWAGPPRQLVLINFWDRSSPLHSHIQSQANTPPSRDAQAPTQWSYTLQLPQSIKIRGGQYGFLPQPTTLLALVRPN